jgi:hypothetical protein
MGLVDSYTATKRKINFAEVEYHKRPQGVTATLSGVCSVLSARWSSLLTPGTNGVAIGPRVIRCNRRLARCSDSQQVPERSVHADFSTFHVTFVLTLSLNMFSGLLELRPVLRLGLQSWARYRAGPQQSSWLEQPVRMERRTHASMHFQKAKYWPMQSPSPFFAMRCAHDS